MAVITKDYTFSAGAIIVAAEHNANFNTIYNDYNGNITNANISASAAIADTKLASITTAGKVNVSALTVASQATGDIIYASSATAWARLGVGSNGDFLVLASGLPAYETRIATQAEMETGTSTTKLVTAGRTQYHPGVAKAWGNFNGTGTPAFGASHNLDSSITDNGTGNYTISITTDFSSGNYALAGMAGSAGNTDYFVSVHTSLPAAGSFRINVWDTSGAAQDATYVSVIALGDQA